MKPHQNTLMIAGVVSLLLWIVPIFGFILLPLQYLNTHLHEFSHAITAVLTGGSVDYIKVFSNGSGVTYASGSELLVDSAGYLGATIIGGLMIFFSRTERGAVVTLRALGVVMLFSFIFWVRGDPVGVISGVLWISVLIALPSFVKGRNLVFVAQFLGMQQCLESVQALYVLLKISTTFGEAKSDAANMQAYTGVPAIVWALLWGAVGLGVLYVTLRSAWIHRPAAE